MPRTKPTLISVEFRPSYNGEREVYTVWTGTPEAPGPQQLYIGVLRCTNEVALTDEFDGQELYKWHLATIPVDATFTVPTKQAMDNRPVRAARWMIRAAYAAAGYGLFAPAGE